MRVVFRPDMTEQMTDFLWEKMDQEYTILERAKKKQHEEFGLSL